MSSDSILHSDCVTLSVMCHVRHFAGVETGGGHGEDGFNTKTCARPFSAPAVLVSPRPGLLSCDILNGPQARVVGLRYTHTVRQWHHRSPVEQTGFDAEGQLARRAW